MEVCIKLNDLIHVIESNEDGESYVNLVTGQVVTVYAETFKISEEYDPNNIEELDEWERKDVLELWKIEKDFEQYKRIPKVDIFDEQVVLKNFCAEVEDEKIRKKLDKAIKSIFGEKRIVSVLKKNELYRDFLEFRDKMMENQVISWAEFNDLKVES